MRSAGRNRIVGARTSPERPAEVAAIAYHNQALVYDLLFKVAADMMLTIAADPKHLGHLRLFRRLSASETLNDSGQSGFGCVHVIADVRSRIPWV